LQPHFWEGLSCLWGRPRKHNGLLLSGRILLLVVGGGTIVDAGIITAAGVAGVGTTGKPRIVRRPAVEPAAGLRSSCDRSRRRRHLPGITRHANNQLFQLYH
jgi:hypothetical protein